MKLPISWLREYVDVDIDAEELAHRLTMAGIEVDAIERQGHIDNVVVGEVLAVAPHPNADKLRVVKVNDGDSEHEVVCGAPNVAAGQRIAFAGIGAELYDPYSDDPDAKRKLRRSKIRGVESRGMVCSERELGIGEDHDGILVLDTDAPLGTPIGDVLGDTVLDLELTPNRPDCLGMVGLARDVAALTGQTLRLPDTTYPESDTAASDRARVTISDPDLCPRYVGAVIEGVTIGESPPWLKERLLSIGERPINNVVDATNFVMFELGQPLHAFDYDKVAHHHVVVRRARHGEELETLDGVKRKLDTESLLIADPLAGIGLAGVIGGKHSEITDATCNILLEAANFNPQNNRRTATMLGTKTEATLRFEKGLRADLAAVAIRRCVKVIIETAGGTACKGLIDEYPGRGNEQTHVDLTREHITRVMGIRYDDAYVVSILTRLGFILEPKADGWRVEIPYWRSDITIPEDLIEEIARIGGYDNLETTNISGMIPASGVQQAGAFRRRVADVMASMGAQQMISYIATSAERVHLGGSDPGLPAPLIIENPVSSNHAALRTTLRAAVIEAAARNTRTWRGPVALFETGKVFLAVDEEPLPDEVTMLVAVLTGPRSELNWHADDAQCDFYDAKGVAEGLLDALGIEADWSSSDAPGFQAGTCAVIQTRARRPEVLGYCGKIDDDVWATADAGTSAAYMLELNVARLEQIVGGASKGDAYRPYFRYPEAHRDIALVMGSQTPAGAAVQVCSQNKLVTSATVFDVHTGGAIPEGKKSVAIRIVFQADSGTLNAKQVSRAESQIVSRLERELGATLRQ